ncbi:ribosomal protein L6 [Pneumocystis carinii B80]|uniref:Large ribosomal subunit protein uL6m n=1 Tax=Pneumocystis carinii (strain B80) TaxID=1408658 RepID=A0A0W4ZNE2_PNEC8|nr:ribosomal protein L6 [Pneumocystis carinii B80]KTW29830.1 ribosomal protein L6 [Pneumocystis carinii B80]
MEIMFKYSASSMYNFRKSFFPSFLVAFLRKSHIGSKPLFLPRTAKLQVSIAENIPNTKQIAVEGPNGCLSLYLPSYIDINHCSLTNKVKVSVENPMIKKQRSMWGTARSLLSNMIVGVTEYHHVTLRLVGIGYKAFIENDSFLSLKVGYSHPILLKIPDGVFVTCPSPTQIILKGCDKVIVTQFAANIRKWRKPEPYKGKGIYVDDEKIILKSAKTR